MQAKTPYEEEEENMFLVLTRYVKDMQEVDKLLPAH